MSGRTVVVNHNGELTACSEVVDKNIKDWNIFGIGNLNSGVDIAKLEYLSGRIVTNMEKCKNCFAKYICRGGCAHKGLTQTGGLFSPSDYHCQFIKKIVPILIKRMVIGRY